MTESVEGAGGVGGATGAGGAAVGESSAGIGVFVESPRAPGVEELLRLGDEYHLALYGAGSYYGLDLAALEASDVRMFVARDSATRDALGTVAIVLGPDDFAEVKRMFVHERARGRGVARRLILAAEAYARTAGVATLRLETGPRSPEALSFYAAVGYTEIDRFGQYVGDESSVCFAKSLST